MKIGILGSGGIGGSLGRLWARGGHEVLFASRHPDELDDLVERANADAGEANGERMPGASARSGTPDEAIAFGDVVLDALPFAASMELPPEPLADKLLISASNHYPQRDGDIELGGLSQSEALAARLSGTSVVKAFNMMRADEMRRRADGESVAPLAIFLSGGDDAERRTVAELIELAGFAPLHTGGLETGRLFQTNAPLYGVQLDEAGARAALEDARAAS